MSEQTVYDEMKDFEKRCNNRSSSLMAFSVIYETVDAKENPIIRRTVMVCPSAMHVVMRFPQTVKMELLSDATVTVAPIINPPAFGNEGDEEAPDQTPDAAPISRAPVVAPLVQDPAPAPMPKRIPLLPGLQLCRQCKHSPFKNPERRCTGGGHRFDKDPATKRCEQFEFP